MSRAARARCRPRLRRAVLALAAVVVAAGCASGARSVEAACRTLDGLTVAGPSLGSAEQIAVVAEQLDELQAVIPSDYEADVRALRDGIQRVLQLATAHPDADNLAALPAEARQEANDTLVAITWPARRLESFQASSCPSLPGSGASVTPSAEAS